MSTQRTINIFFAICFLFTISCRERTPDIVDPIIVTSLRPGINEFEMEFDGLMRDITVQLPISFIQNTSYPVVFFFHGFGGNKNWEYEEKSSFVEEENFVAVYPQGIANSWNTGAGEVPSTANDVGFALEILRWLETEINIDTMQIYSMGYSNGAVFSYILALETDKFAAIAPLAGSFWEELTINSGISKISVMQIHEELDQKVPYHGGKSSALSFSFESVIQTSIVLGTS